VSDTVDYSDVMSEEDIAPFERRRRQQAKRAINPLDKESWLRLAAEWIKLTQAAEKRL
jgi:hypothetical protein